MDRVADDVPNVTPWCGRTYFIRLRVGADMGSAVEVTLPPSPPAPAAQPAPSTTAAPVNATSSTTPAAAAGHCTYKGKSYALGKCGTLLLLLTKFEGGSFPSRPFPC